MFSDEKCWGPQIVLLEIGYSELEGVKAHLPERCQGTDCCRINPHFDDAGAHTECYGTGVC